MNHPNDVVCESYVPVATSPKKNLGTRDYKTLHVLKETSVQLKINKKGRKRKKERKKERKKMPLE